MPAPTSDSTGETRVDAARDAVDTGAVVAVGTAGVEASETEGVAASDRRQVQTRCAPTASTASPCSSILVDRIKGLFQEAGITPDQAKAAIQRRGVNRLAELSTAQAEELVTKLQERVNGQAVENSLGN